MPDLPFQVGELAESRSFQFGFRGAWFRCKIRGIRMKNAAVTYLLEYFDYPDQKPSWIKLYQKPLTNVSKSKGFNRELMLRPSFPTIYHESENLDVNTISEVIVIVDNIWKVGDLVDWFEDGCYWSGRVTKILGNDKVQIDLLPPPLGEGKSYEALSKYLRPSLDWCPEKGWTVPMPMLQGDGCSRPCARIVNPANSGGVVNIRATDGTKKVGQPTVRTYSEKATINGGYNEYPTKKMRSNRSLCLNSMSSNTIEAAILDLEELVNRIKWLRDVLNLRAPLSDTKQPSWEFSQHHAPCE